MNNREFFDSFTTTAFRLETLPQYLGTSDPAFEEHARTGRLLPLEQRPAKQAWMTAVRRARRELKHLRRVHVIRLPLTPYLRYELATYPENVAAGEDVRIAVVDEHPALAALDTDFWLLDGTLALAMAYDEQGRFVSLTPTRNPVVVTVCRDQRDLAVACSVPLQEFLAAVA